MIISIGERDDLESTLNIGTHSGIFHCDDVVGIAILELAYMNFEGNINIVRTNDPNELKMLHIVVGIGGGMFDNHSASSNTRRSTGELYASAGLIWRSFANEAIKNVAAEQAVSIDISEIQEIKQQVDREVIIPVDLEENGEAIGNHTFSFIPKFLPTWLETPDYDKAFMRVEAIVSSILKEIIKEKVAQVAKRKELYNGLFQCDEVVGIAILELAYIDCGADMRIEWTRNAEGLKELDIVIDIDGKMSRHHIEGFNTCRTTGEMYASAGLIWKSFAEKAIKNVATKQDFISIDDGMIQEIKQQIDREVIIPVDMENSGKGTSNHTFSFVQKILPTWPEILNYNDAFISVEAIVFDILEEIIKEKVVKVATRGG